MRVLERETRTKVNDARSNPDAGEDERAAAMTEVEFARKRGVVDAVATEDENPEEADKDTTDEEVRKVDPAPHQLGKMDDREGALLLEKDVAKSARRSKAGEFARMIAALVTAPELSKTAIAESPVERYIPTELLQVALTAGKYAEMAAKWRRLSTNGAALF